jgi:hypothetical protein
MHQKSRSRLCAFVALLGAWLLPACAQQASNNSAPAHTLFFEAENFTAHGNGWKPAQDAQTKRASLVKALNGATGATDGTATQSVAIPRAGTWRVWVRYMVHSAYRGPFDVDVLSGDKVVASHAFDLKAKPGVDNWDYAWDSFDAELAAGENSLRLRKHDKKNCSIYTRNVDAILLTDDLQHKPDHVPFGPQTWMKVTLGGGYEKPVQIHIFADHYRSPWYAHFAVSKDGMENGLNPKRQEALLKSGETTGWVNISRTVYQDSGAHLLLTPAYRYADNAPRFNAEIEFAPRPDDDAVVKMFNVEYSPSTLHIVVPPNLESKENIARLRSDGEFAQEYGKLADTYDWPKTGKAPVKFPFFVAANLDPNTMDAGVVARELKTLKYFGFNGAGNGSVYEKTGFPHKQIGGVGWYTKGSYSAPDIEKMRARAAALYKEQVAAGIKPDEIDYAMVMDEPTGEAASKLAADAASIEGFRNWLKSKKLTPADLLVNAWDEVKPVPETQRDRFPALHYYTQQYRTVALGNFVAVQKQLLKEQWKIDFPIVANFSDGAIYHGNFYGQGVDYFTLLHETEQNAIWSEDWSNAAATYQDATYNVELMRAAARKKGQVLGQYLIAYAGRKGYDIRLKAVSEAARSVKLFKSFAYGPVWATHEHSPWQKNTAIWRDHAAVVREFGAVEDLLLPAQPRPAEVALLYSSAADAWTIKENLASGFDRMHTWLALAHAQIPVDVVHESEVEDGLLAKYKVAYLSDPNLTRATAQKLADWVRAGGTLVLAAGAGERDEFNRPLSTLDALLPYRRQPAQVLQKYHAAGRFLTTLSPKDTVTAGAATMDVLSVKQTFAGVPQDGAMIEATFKDGSPAAIRSAAGQGFVVARGYFPALDYMRKALIAKGEAAKAEPQPDENNGIPGAQDVESSQPGENSYNPWQYPAAVRDALVTPVRAAHVEPPIKCSVPLVDAVYMTAPQGVLIPLANYTLQPIQKMTLEIAVDKPVREVRSVYQGVLPFEKLGDDKIRVTLPLECTDFLTVR